MDGGRRVLRSLRESFAASLPLVHFPLPQVRAAATGGPYAAVAPINAAPRPQPRRRVADAPRLTGFALAARPGIGIVAVALLFAGVGLAGAMQNGDYDAFVAREGQPLDIFAKVLGFDIAAVTIAGQSQMTEKEVLEASGVNSRASLPFLDASAVRARLMAIPLVKSARVMKLYPNRLVIAVEERKPHALWQRDGRVFVISEDGVAIDELRDKRYLGLPFVVGEGAHKRLLEFLKLLEAAGDLRQRVKAGVLVAGRRWDIEMTNGVMAKLPEENPGAAMETLVRLQREARILDRDVMSVDLRAPDRVSVRLTEEAAAAREAASPHKTKKTGG